MLCVPSGGATSAVGMTDMFSTLCAARVRGLSTWMNNLLHNWFVVSLCCNSVICLSVLKYIEHSNHLNITHGCFD